MSEKPIHVDVCVATYRRPLMLKRLLHSLLQQRLCDTIIMRICVVDNDASESARQTVQEHANTSAVTVIYDTESVQNIAMARNKALSLCRGDYMAFIDDDEVASPEWLQSLIDSAQKYDAHVVFGPVVPEYPTNTPKWVLKGKFFERERKETGKSCPHGATNNVLIRREPIVATGLQFNPDYGRTGGEDIEFFCRLGRLGFRMVWCDEALVTEPVVDSRMTADWLIRRAFRGGQLYGRLVVAPKPVPLRIPWAIQRVIYLAVAVIALPVAWLLGKHAFIRILMKVGSNLGHLSSQSGWLYEGYR